MLNSEEFSTYAKKMTPTPYGDVLFFTDKEQKLSPGKGILDTAEVSIQLIGLQTNRKTMTIEYRTVNGIDGGTFDQTISKDTSDTVCASELVSIGREIRSQEIKDALLCHEASHAELRRFLAYFGYDIFALTKSNDPVVNYNEIDYNFDQVDELIAKMSMLTNEEIDRETRMHLLFQIAHVAVEKNPCYALLNEIVMMNLVNDDINSLIAPTEKVVMAFQQECPRIAA